MSWKYIKLKAMFSAWKVLSGVSMWLAYKMAEQAAT